MTLLKTEEPVAAANPSAAEQDQNRAMIDNAAGILDVGPSLDELQTA